MTSTRVEVITSVERRRRWSQTEKRTAGSSIAATGGHDLTKLAKLDEGVTETLEFVQRQWKVVQLVREKFTCRQCEKISQAPATFHVLPRGFADRACLPWSCSRSTASISRSIGRILHSLLSSRRPCFRYSTHIRRRASRWGNGLQDPKCPGSGQSDKGRSGSFGAIGRLVDRLPISRKIYGEGA